MTTNSRRQFIADAGRRQELHPGADMNPRAHDGVVDQHLVHHPLQQPGMAEIISRVDRIGFADIGEILLCGLAGPMARHGAEPLADLI